MNFLQLVQRLALESGTLAGGTTLASVVGVSGRAAKLVAWANEAWEDLQRARDWRWMRAEFSSSLTAGTKRYTSTSFSIDSFSRWMRDVRGYRPYTIYDPAIGQADENEICEISFESWRMRYDRGAHDPQRPTVYAISPADELCFGTTPDQTYTIRGEYRKGVQTLTGNNDTPEMPAEFHMLIVWRAMQLMAESDEAIQSLQIANSKYKAMFRQLCAKQLDAVSTGGNTMA